MLIRLAGVYPPKSHFSHPLQVRRLVGISPKGSPTGMGYCGMMTSAKLLIYMRLCCVRSGVEALGLEMKGVIVHWAFECGVVLFASSLHTCGWIRTVPGHTLYIDSPYCNLYNGHVSSNTLIRTLKRGPEAPENAFHGLSNHYVRYEYRLCTTRRNTYALSRQTHVSPLVSTADVHLLRLRQACNTHRCRVSRPHSICMRRPCTRVTFFVLKLYALCVAHATYLVSAEHS